MADGSHIEWTDATWNPVTGCKIVSPGCTNCYAMKLAGTRLKHHPSRAGLTVDCKSGPVWNGQVRLNEEWLTQPLKWKRPRMIFVCAHGDLFAENVPDEWIDRVFAVMALAPQHTFQVLTKRARRMQEYLTKPYRPGHFTTVLDDGSTIDTPAANIRVHAAMCDLLPKAPPQALNGAAKWQDEHFPGGDGFMRQWPLPNVWLGVSAERRFEWLVRTTYLRNTPAALRFVSVEPLLDDLGEIDLTDLHWIIVGGESGNGARPMHPAWPRQIRDDCKDAGTAFFFKQWGEHLPIGQVLPGCGKVHGATAVKPGRMKLHYGGTPQQRPEHAFAERGVEFTSTDDGSLTFRVSKKRAGRLLDGVEHNGMPEAREVPAL